MSDQYPPPPSGDPNQPPSAPYSGGAPYQGAPYPGAPGAPVPPPQKKRSVGKIILIVVGILLAVCILCTVGVFFLARDTWNDIVNAVETNPTTAQVGDCLGGNDIESEGKTGSLDVKKVDCADAEAKYKVVGRVPGKTAVQAQTDDTICQPYVDEGAERSLWLSESGETTGTVFCLAPNK